MSAPFTITEKVRFRHCDPAGIVFYPRYFEMINDAVEAFFEAVIGLPFSGLHDTGAVPTVAIEAAFPAPSRLGEILSISITPLRLGRTSFALETKAICGNEVRFLAKSTLVLTASDGKPQPWPTFVAKALKTHTGEQE